ncbi:hypothetical protein [Lapidilactobacillus salsurivasis]
MKERFIALQARLMDVIILSGIVLIGALTIVGFFYGIVAAHVYLQENKTDKWQVLKKRQTIITCLLLEISALFVGIIFILNLNLIPQLSAGFTIVLTCFLTMGILIVLPLYSILLQGLAQGRSYSKDVLLDGVRLILSGIPVWIGDILLLLVAGLITYLFPALAIVSIGLLVIWTDRIVNAQRVKIFGFQEER